MEGGNHVFKLIPVNRSEEQEKMTQAFDSWSQWLKRPVHGTLYGQALHTLQPPQGARGTVLVWLKNTADYVKTYKDNDQPMRLKKEYKNHWDSMCAIYFVYFPLALQVPLRSRILLGARRRGHRG